LSAVCTCFQHLKTVTSTAISARTIPRWQLTLRLRLKCSSFSYELKSKLSLVLTRFFNEYVRRTSHPTYSCWMCIPFADFCFRALFEVKLLRFASCLCFFQHRAFSTVLEMNILHFYP
jgi:hypothetical protein